MRKKCKKVLTFADSSAIIYEQRRESKANAKAKRQPSRTNYGGIAQLARAFGSYPTGRWFKSDFRYQPFLRLSQITFRLLSDVHGPLVKRLRHGPFTAVTWVRFPYGSPKKAIALAVAFLLYMIKKASH